MTDLFSFGGLHHLALVSHDMARTVSFYRDVLGMPLVKTIDLPNGGGQHFFFDIGNGNTLAFFWFARTRDRVPGVSSPKQMIGATTDWTTAPGSMNHVAITVPTDKIEEYRDRLLALGVECSPIMNHDNSEAQMAPENHPGVWLRSVYLFGPDGELLELAAWTKSLNPAIDATALPRNADGTPVDTSAVPVEAGTTSRT